MDLILNFKPVEDSKGEMLTCLLCNKIADETTETQYRRADILIAVKVTVTIHVCSVLCEKNLISSKESMARLKHGINIARKQNRIRALKVMGRRFGVLAFFFLAVACAPPHRTRVEHKPRYRQEQGPYVMPTKPKKVNATGTKQRSLN
jgi:hypothetical protein